MNASRSSVSPTQVELLNAAMARWCMHHADRRQRQVSTFGLGNATGNHRVRILRPQESPWPGQSDI
jgi:hypothetical protein